MFSLYAKVRTYVRIGTESGLVPYWYRK